MRKKYLEKKPNRKGNHYKDRKYVRLAAHAAYSGVLIALDSILQNKKGRKSVEWYQKNLCKLDRKALDTFSSIYEVVHLYMVYDGVKNVNVSKV